MSYTDKKQCVCVFAVMDFNNLFLCTGSFAIMSCCLPVARKCLEEEEARRFMRQIVSAVDHLHQSGIVHRCVNVDVTITWL